MTCDTKKKRSPNIPKKKNNITNADIIVAIGKTFFKG